MGSSAIRLFTAASAFLKIGLAQIDHGMGIARRFGIVGFRIADQRVFHRQHKARQLGLHHLEGVQRFRRILHFAIGRGIHHVIEIEDAVLARRMVHGELVDLVGAHRLFVREALEGVVHAHRRLMRGQQQLGGDLVGGGFLHPGEGRHLAHGIGLADAHDGHADFARARDHRAQPHHHGEQHGDHRLLHAIDAARQMAGRDMAGLVRHHPDHLVGDLQPQQDAGEDEDVLAAIAIGGEGVDRPAHQPDLGRGVQARGAGQRRLIAAQHFLGFGVAQQADVFLGIGRSAIGQQGGRHAGGKTEFAQKRMFQRQAC